MAKKRYEVRGMMEWHPEFAAGRTRVRVSFTGGHLCGGCVTPAVFETSDPVVQAVIERSEAFSSKRIRLAPGCRPMERGQKAPVKMDFNNLETATEMLHYDKGVPLSQLMDEESCIREGRKLGLEISFQH